MKKSISFKFLLASLGVGSFLIGCNASDHQLSTDEIKKKLLSEVPNITSIDSVNKTNIDNIYEVVVGRKIFYTTADAKYIIIGNIVDPVSKKSITDERMQKFSVIDWNKLPLDLAIKEVIGTGKYQLAVFSDPDCPYCQMFEKDIVSKLTDATVYTFLFPLSIHQNAKHDSQAIWCSADRANTWINWMRDKTPLPTDTSCDVSAIDKSMELGEKYVQVEGTPTIILSNGQILSGMLPADQLLEKMKEVYKEQGTDKK